MLSRSGLYLIVDVRVFESSLAPLKHIRVAKTHDVVPELLVLLYMSELVYQELYKLDEKVPALNVILRNIRPRKEDIAIERDTRSISERDLLSLVVYVDRSGMCEIPMRRRDEEVLISSRGRVCIADVSPGPPIDSI